MSGLPYLGIVLQGVVIAFTIFLGRIYVLTYHETLGVPVFETRLSAIDYAIVSPGVTVIGIGLSIALVSYFLLSGPLTRLQLPRWQKCGLGCLLMVAGPVVVSVTPIVTTDSVMRSLWIVLSMAMSLYGGAMLGLAMRAKSKPEDSRPEQKQVEEKASRRFLVSVITVGLVVLWGTYAYNFSSSTAHDEAADALHQSPQATVQFASGDSGSFRVIMIGEQFVYLLPEENEGLQAFPHDRIAQIDYAGPSESYAR